MNRRWFALLLCTVWLAAVSAQTAKKPAIPPLKPMARKALLATLTGLRGEYVGATLYAKVVQRFGQVEPYAYLLRAEGKRRSALQELFRKYRLPFPHNPYVIKSNTPTRLKQSAEAGIQLAQGNSALYEKLLPDVVSYDDIVRTFRRLQFETRNDFLPLLRAAEANGGFLPPDSGKLHPRR